MASETSTLEGAEDVPAFTPFEIAHAHNELAIFSNASRAILLHLCQRLARVESSLRAFQNDVFRIRSDISRGTTEIKGEVSDIHGQVQSLSSRLSDVASVVDLFQNELNSHKSSVTTLSASVEDERVRLTAVDVKIDNQRDEFDTRMQELNLKLDEIPRALAALQKTGRDPLVGFTFRAAERDKLSLGNHISRGDAGEKPGGPPYTDLQPFTIPDDMKEKIEMRIRQKESSKSEEDKRAASELADAYRRLQLAGYPRVTEIYMLFEQCRTEVKRAFDFIRDSNLQLFACCESKVERVDILSLQNEFKALRNKVRELEGRHGGRTTQPNEVALDSQVSAGKHFNEAGGLRAWNLDKYFSVPIGDGPQGNTPVRVAAYQVPELRVSLLEMSRNLHLLQKQWTKTHAQPMDAIAKQHLQTLIAQLNEGYSVMTEQPVDLLRVEKYVEKISCLLATEYSQRILKLMASSKARIEETTGEGIAAALEKYAQAFTDGITARPEEAQGFNIGQNAILARDIHDQKRVLDQLQAEMMKVVESQRTFESALANPAKSGMLSADQVSSTDIRFATQQQQLYGLQDQLSLLHRQAMQQEDMIAELTRQFSAFRKERTPIGVMTGQRLTRVSPNAHSIQHGSPLTTALRRTNSSILNTDLDAYLAITAVDQSDRPKSQAKLDPLFLQRGGMGFEVQPNGTAPSGRTTLSVAAPIPRNGPLHKIQTRAQGLRPKSGIHNDVNA